METYIVWSADSLERKITAAFAQNSVNEIPLWNQKVTGANVVIRAWIENSMGRILWLNGYSGAAVVPDSALAQLANTQAQVASVLGDTISVGVSMNVSEAQKALAAAQAGGGNKILFYTPDLDKPPAQESNEDILKGIATSALSKSEGQLDDLIKNHGPFKFPKLGVPDDRRSTAVVNTPAQLETHLRTQFAPDVNRKDPWGDGGNASWDYEAALKDKIKGGGADRANGMADSDSSDRSWAKGGALRDPESFNPEWGGKPTVSDKIAMNKEVQGTVMHENLHNMFSRVSQKDPQGRHGDRGQRYLAFNLMRSIPKEYQDAVKSVRDWHWSGNSEIPNQDEEGFGSLINYLNEPDYRKQYHESVGFTQDAPESQAFHTKMKRAYAALHAAAQVATPRWTQDSEPWTQGPMQKSEQTDKFIEAKPDSEPSGDDPAPNMQNAGPDEIKQTVLRILKQIKSQKKTLDQLRQVSPETYQALIGAIQAMIVMARAMAGAGGEKEAPPEDAPPPASAPAGQPTDMQEQAVTQEKELAIGIQQEMKEHQIPEGQALKLAQDHLKNDPQYYSKRSA